MKKSKYLISVPYIYPVCPLSIDHAKIMLIADINARIARCDGKEVCFPIAAHYSGVTAEKTIEKLKSNDINVKNKERDKFIIGYKTPRNIVDGFDTPEKILDYYTSQTILDLKRLGISCDYSNFYKTNTKDYENFVINIFQNYESEGLLIENIRKELALNYDEKKWRIKTSKNLNKLNFISPNLKNNVISAIDNIRSDWGVLRNYGIGVKYKDNYVIDPMFDSELFVIYDLFKKFEKQNIEENTSKLFKEVLRYLKGDKTVDKKNKIIKLIANWLPTDLFVCEEHLKNWIVKKTFAESLIFEDKYQTRNYFITGMGYIDGKRMSSSRGTAILLKDLLDSYGSSITRMIILFTGGHPSKMYNYSTENIEIIKKMLNEFYDFWVYLNGKLLDIDCGDDYIDEFDKLKENLSCGFYQQVLVDIMKNLKKKYYNSDINTLKKLKNTINYFIYILLPDLKF